jgi:YfiR/HmsC-like
MDILTLGRPRLRTAVALCVTLMGLTLADGLWSQVSIRHDRAPDESLEYRVKAAYLLNFTRYVEWPPPPASNTRLSICVMGTDPFGRILDATVAGRTVQGRSLEVRRVQNAPEARGCEVVFVSRETWRRGPESLKALADAGSLTVGESEQFARNGGVIGFVIRDETVRFVINAAARDRAGLRISSRMLSLAAAIYDRERS